MNIVKKNKVPIKVGDIFVSHATSYAGKYVYVVLSRRPPDIYTTDALSVYSFTDDHVGYENTSALLDEDIYVKF